MSDSQVPWWADVNNLPEHGDPHWAVWQKNRSLVCADFGELREKLGRWNPLNGVLVGRPGAQRFQPPMSIAELQVSLGRRLRIGQKVLVGMSLVFALLAIGIAGAIHNRETGIFAVACLLAALLASFEMRQVADERAINARTLFYFHLWHGSQLKQTTVVWFGMCAIVGAVQIFMQRHMGGLENLVVGYGAYYPAMSRGEWWRVLIGPLFHSGIPHFMANMVGIALLGPVACMVLTARAAVLAMLLGASLGLLAAYAGSAPEYDSFLGASGGLFALFGLIVGTGVFRPALLPSGLTIYWGLLALIFGVSAEIGPKVSSIAHLAGFATGLVLSFITFVFATRAGAKFANSIKGVKLDLFDADGDPGEEQSQNRE